MNEEVLTPGTNRAADAPPRLNSHARGFWELQGQWRIQGRGPGGPRPPYFSTKIRPEGRKKNFLEAGGGGGGGGGGGEKKFFLPPPPPPPPPYLRVSGLTTKQIYRQHESEKTRMHASRVLEVEQGSFTPMVFTATGGMADECKTYHNRLAELLSNKKGEDYSNTISWIRVSLIRPPEVCAVFNLC